MKYLLLSDVHFNGKVIKAGEISELKEIQNNINSLLSVKAIVPYTKEEVLKQAIAEAHSGKTDKIENLINESKAKVEADIAKQEELADTGIDVKSSAALPLDTSKAKKSGRPAKTKE